MELSGNYWDLSSALNPSPAPVSFSQHEAAQAMVLHAHGGGAGGTAHHQLMGCGGGGGAHAIPMVDPHLTCLKLGKRHYFEDGGERRLEPPPGPALLLGGKRGKGFGNVGASSSASSSAVAAAGPVPRCQVEGCNLTLVNAKDYHRRHKVCEMHSKAPKVVVLGMEQRFCQQCSRFHVVSEFDDSKRSCRRRLAGHNERRRKNTNESMGKNPSQECKTAGGRFPCLASSPKGRALSLLSSKTYPASSWESSAELSLRSSAALRELIAENRAAVLARQLFSDRSWPNAPDQARDAQPFLSHAAPHHHQHPLVLESPGWALFHEPAVNVTLDLMQAPTSSYPIVHGRSRPKENDECCEIWKSLEGTHVV